MENGREIGSLVRYERADRVATITLDDGKRNALSLAMLTEIEAALAQAEKDEVAVVLTGREQVFSAGFDLKVLRSGGPEAARMLRAGYSMTARLLSFPRPVIAACPGHAYAMGAFMLLSTDYRIGVAGDFTYVANEVAIGLPMPRVGAEVLRLRLTPAAYQRAVVLAEKFTPEQALAAGFIDRLVDPEHLTEQAHTLAHSLMDLDMKAHADSKRSIRAESIDRIRRGVKLDLRDAVVLGVKQFVKAKWPGAA